jgi:peptide subunit release factor 1 (eRF1)
MELAERLARFDPGRHWVVSCYLKLEPRDRARSKYLIKLKNRIKERLAWLAGQELDRTVREQIAEDLDRVRDYLEHPGNLPAGQGIAIFACQPRGLFEAIALPRVYRSRLVVDRTALVRELAAVTDEFGVVICAAYDRAMARLFRVTALEVEELPSLAAGDVTRTGRFHGASVATRGGTGFAVIGEHNFNQRIRTEKHRHYAHIAQRLFELVRAEPVRGVVLASHGEENAAIQNHLHPYVGSLVLGSARLNPKAASAAAVLSAVLEVRAAADREHARKHLRAMQDGLSTGWSANGIEPALEALARGQVRTLLVDGAEAPGGWRCSASGRLTTQANGCGAEGPAIPVPDVVDDAVEDALRQHSQVIVIEEDGDRRAVDGLGALFRFR